ncbi:hypothetical protein JT358_02215 [Micrococcales bacterium 31B]|nr:hypothetical protein [Micrococcales bacterium 31B]
MGRITQAAGVLLAAISLCTVSACAGSNSAAPAVLTPSVGASYTPGAAPPASATGGATAAVTVDPNDLTSSATAATESPSASASDDAQNTAPVTLPDRTSVAPVAPSLSTPNGTTPSASAADPNAPAGQNSAPSTTTQPTASPTTQLQPQAAKAAGSVNFGSIDDVAAAAAFNACLVDADVDPSMDAATQRARTFFLDDATLVAGKDCSTLVNGGRFSALKQHRGFVNVKLGRLTIAGTPPDTATEATRTFAITVTPAGRDGWSEAAWTGVAGMTLTQDNGRWIVDSFKIEAS